MGQGESSEEEIGGLVAERTRDQIQAGDHDKQVGNQPEVKAAPGPEEWRRFIPFDGGRGDCRRRSRC